MLVILASRLLVSLRELWKMVVTMHVRRCVSLITASVYGNLTNYNKCEAVRRLLPKLNGT